MKKKMFFLICLVSLSVATEIMCASKNIGFSRVFMMPQSPIAMKPGLIRGVFFAYSPDTKILIVKNCHESQFVSLHLDRAKELLETVHAGSRWQIRAEQDGNYKVPHLPPLLKNEVEGGLVSCLKIIQEMGAYPDLSTDIGIFLQNLK